MAAALATETVQAKTGPGRKIARYGVLYSVATFFVLFAAIPFAWMVFTVFKRSTDLYNGKNNPLLYNESPTTANVRTLFADTNYLTFVWNTIVVAFFVTIITIVIAVPAAYSLT